MFRFGLIDVFWNCRKYYSQYKFSEKIRIPSIANFPTLYKSESNIIKDVKEKNDAILKKELNLLALDFSDEQKKWNKNYSKFSLYKDEKLSSNKYGDCYSAITTTLLFITSFGIFYIIQKKFFIKK
jgi:hypothetical protein